MPKTAVEQNKAEKVGGCFREGSVLAKFYLAIKDGKAHEISTLKKTFRGKLVDYGINNMRYSGRRAGLFTVKVADGTVRLIELDGKPAKRAKASANGNGRVAKAKTVKAKTTKPAARAKAADDEAEADEQGIPKFEQNAAKLIRRTLQESGEWTTNKLLERVQENGMDPATAQKVLTRELEAGGIKKIKGVLELQ